MSADLAIVDSGGANIASLCFALDRLGVTGTVTTNAATIRAAKRVILPGVGAAADAMARLRDHALAELIPSLTQPVLGICLGMQLLARHTEEQDTATLGVLPTDAKRLPASMQQPVPNMGWCSVSKVVDHPLTKHIRDGNFFYFVHSYALPPGPVSLANATHAREFCAIAAHRNFCAVQFHPERSQAAGAQLLKNFLSLAQ